MLKKEDIIEIRNLLKQANIKVTIPRLLTLKVLKQASMPMTAYDIETVLSEFDDRINLASIYSSLRTFQNFGFIQCYKSQHNTQGLYSFSETITPIRVICKNCSHVQNIHNQTIHNNIEHSCKNEKIVNLDKYSLVLNVSTCEFCPK